MLDERWSDEVEEIAETLRRILENECTHEDVRAAEASVSGRSDKLETELNKFGLNELEADADWFARIAYELGRVLAPTTHVEEMPVLALLGRPGVVLGFNGIVPAGVEYVAVKQDDGVYIEKLTGEGRRCVAGDFLVKYEATGNGEKVGDLLLADKLKRFGQMCDAARMIGAGQALLKYGVDYACEREQFGKAIGGYQAVANRLTEASTALDGAELLLRKAAFTAMTPVGGDGAPMAHFATMIWTKAVDAARNVSTNVHQAFGGNGFTEEYNVQLFSRRLRSWVMRGPRTGSLMADLARKVLDAQSRDGLELLWHNEVGLPLPRWAKEADGGVVS